MYTSGNICICIRNIKVQLIIFFAFLHVFFSVCTVEALLTFIKLFIHKNLYHLTILSCKLEALI